MDGRDQMYYQGCQKDLYEMIEEIKSCQPEVKASKLDKRLRSYSHSKIAPISHQFWVYMDVFDICNKRRRCLLVAAQPPTLNIFDIPDNSNEFLKFENQTIIKGDMTKNV